MNSKVYLNLTLHAHLPFINLLENYQIEENWFYEAVVESYIPLIRMLENLIDEGIKPSITFSISPTLGAMLENEMMQKRVKEYILSRLSLCEKEFENNEDEKINKVLEKYHNFYSEALETFNKYSGDIITPLKRFQAQNQIEIITTSASHSILPLYRRKEILNAQILTAIHDYEERFNYSTLGFWLSECAYSPNIDDTLKKSGLNYFFLENHAMGNLNKNIFKSYKTKLGLNYFLRDANSSREVWSAEFGYPGNGNYREFYKDIGYDREVDHLFPFTKTKIKIPTGLKYYKITGKKVSLSDKEIYDFDNAQNQTLIDAKDFLNKRIKQGFEIEEKTGHKTLIVNAYDAELFGHWWFEGPKFLENLIRTIRYERLPIQIITPKEYLQMMDNQEVLQPEVSSWGENGYFDPWLNNKNDFIYPLIYELNTKMIKTANRFKNKDLNHLQLRALNQASRETLLAASSDWPFLIYTGPHSEYAEKRLKTHISNAYTILNSVIENNIDEKLIYSLEKENYIFPKIDFRIFSSESGF